MSKLNFNEIREYITNSYEESIVMIGCDSRRYRKSGKWVADYATVVCIRKASGFGSDVLYHGCRVFADRRTLPDYGVVQRSGKIKNLR